LARLSDGLRRGAAQIANLKHPRNFHEYNPVPTPQFLAILARWGCAGIRCGVKALIARIDCKTLHICLARVRVARVKACSTAPALLRGALAALPGDGRRRLPAMGVAGFDRGEVMSAEGSSRRLSPRPFGEDATCRKPKTLKLYKAF
jgi:hypothetical protein